MLANNREVGLSPDDLFARPEDVADEVELAFGTDQLRSDEMQMIRADDPEGLKKAHKTKESDQLAARIEATRKSMEGRIRTRTLAFTEDELRRARENEPTLPASKD